MSTIRAAFVSAPGQVEVREIPAPRPGATAAVVEVSLCGICGTDVGGWQSGAGRPAIFGHEWAGRVRQVGTAVDGVRTGERVIMAVPPSCGSCPYCRGGLPQECEYVFRIATGHGPAAPPHGGFASAVPVLASRLLRVPDSVSDEAAAMIEPTAVVMHGLARCPAPVGGSVVVQGAGPIGLLAVQGAVAIGASQVIVVEPDASRRELSLLVGAAVAVAPGDAAAERVFAGTGGLGADLVIECSGVPALVQTGATLARRGGVLLLLGYPKAPSQVDAAFWMRKQLTVQTSLAATRHDFEVACRLIAKGTIDTSPLHTATVGLDDLQSVLTAIASGRSAEVKVLVEPSR